MRNDLFSYQNRLILVFAIAEAALLLDRLTIGFLAPMLAGDLALSNAQLGMLSSVFSIGFAISGYAISGLSDRSGERWIFVVALVAGFSAVSGITGVVTGFASLAMLRIVLGLIEGPFLPIALTLVIAHSTPGRRSFNLAFVQNFGAFILAQLCGPIVLVAIAVNFGWRSAFFFTALPGLIIAIAILMLRRSAPPLEAPAPRPDVVAGAPPGSARSPFAHRNILLCMAIGGCMGSWILLQVTFLPKYLVDVAAMTPTRMSFVMSLLGISGCVASLALPALSDRLGRRPVMMAGMLLATVTPLGALFAYHSTAMLTVAILVGSIGLGCSPLTNSIVPSDSVDRAVLARAMAAVAASSAICGGVIAPTIAGRLADVYGLAVPLWIAGGLALVAFVLVYFLQPPRSEMGQR